MNFQLRSDRVMCVAGPSQSGKTEFVLRLLESKEELFRNPLNKVSWCYGIHNPNLQAQLQSKGYKVHRRLPELSTKLDPGELCGPQPTERSQYDVVCRFHLSSAGVRSYDKGTCQLRVSRKILRTVREASCVSYLLCCELQ